MKSNHFIPMLVSSLLFFPASDSAGAAEVKARADLPIDSLWKLDHIYPTDQAWEEAIVQIPVQIEKITSFQGKLGDSPELLLQCFHSRDELQQNLGKIYAYARMHLDTDQTNGTYQSMQGKAQSLLGDTSAAISFIEPELLSLSENQLQQYIHHPLLKDYRVFLAELLRQKPHMLSPEGEKILASTLNISATPQNIFGALSYGDLNFPSITDSSGQGIILSEGRYGNLIKSSDRKIREEAFQALHQTYYQYRTTYASLLSSSVQKDHFFATQRKYGSDLEASLSPNAIPTLVYHNLIDTVNKNLPLLHRYVSIKKSALNLNEIHLYDLYVPIIDNPFTPFSYEKSTQILLEGLAPLGKEYLTDLKSGLEGGWIDRYENKGKKTGAYSWGVYGVHPFVLMNYDDSLNDVLTLAHELGHSMHSYYSQKNQPFATSDYTIFCAEVASTTNESLVLHHLLKNTDSREERIYLLHQMAESIRTTLYRQTLFAEFELYIHEEVSEKGTITADQMETKWMELYRKYYGSDIVIDDIIKSEWSRIPHFYRDFYVYQYATGISAAWAFSNQIRQGTPEERDAYLQFLQSGSSSDSIQILKNAGVDMSTPAPIEATLREFKWVLDELEKELIK